MIYFSSTFDSIKVIRYEFSLSTIFVKITIVRVVRGYSTDLATFGKNAKLFATYDRVSSNNSVKPTLKIFV